MKPLSLLALLALFKRVESVQCPRGTYSNTTTSANDAVTTSVEQDCFPCDAGTYQDKTGSTACKICMPGKYQPNTGSVDCQLCTNHLTSVAGSSNCAFCKEGFYLDGFYLDDTSIDNCLEAPLATVY